MVDPNNNHPTDSDAGGHAKKNWNSGAAGYRQHVGTPADARPTFEAFRKQSQNSSFSLSHGSLSQFSLGAATGQSPTVDSEERFREGAMPPHSRKTSSSKVGGKAISSSDRMEVDLLTPRHQSTTSNSFGTEMTSFFDVPEMQSPSNTPSLDLSQMHPNHASHLDERRRPMSLPHNTLNPSSPGTLSHRIPHADTLPSSLSRDNPTMVFPQELVQLLNSHRPLDILLLDLRVFPQFSQSRIIGAINLCIPTTLLKRPSFNVQKLAETFTKEQEKETFNRWREAKAIVVYDAGSSQLKDATSSINTLKKFTNEGWKGLTLVIRGGFAGFVKKYPDMVDTRLASELEGSNSRKLTIDPQMPAAAPVAGGCVMPSAKNATNAFFGNIRQNMDLIGGVGQIAIKLPSSFGLASMPYLPTWLRRVADERDQGKTVADQFLGIETAEQQRMQAALTGNVSYGTPNPSSTGSIQIAGIEKGIKNRYKDMLPYEHSRVRLQDVSSGACDYVNASHIKSKWSHRRYVAAQAPVPATFTVSCPFKFLLVLSQIPKIMETNNFQDFWRVAWEQDVRVIVMLTAESESGQRKCHPYWLQGEYGPFKLKSLSERKVSLEPPKRASTTGFGLDPSPTSKRPGMEKRRSTNHGALTLKESPRSEPVPTPSSPDPESPHVIVRKLALSHAGYPFEPMREITQLQYSSWPDFGTPTHPAHVLGLVEYCGTVVDSYDTARGGKWRGGAGHPTRGGERPIVVHCSAGCGRTGTFCTVDSVIDMLKRQRERGKAKAPDGPSTSDRADIADEALNSMEIEQAEDDEVEDAEGSNWNPSADVDLVAETVKDLRLQRVSMVQTLRQFVLCYEAVLEWVVKEYPDKIMMGPAGSRRSFHA